MNGLAMKMIIGLSVVEIVFEPVTDFEPIIGRYGHVAPVKQFVNVRTKKDPVCHVMFTGLRIRPDVRRFENGEGMFRRDRTGASITLGHDDSKKSLPQARPKVRDLAVSRFVVSWFVSDSHAAYSEKALV